MLTIDKTGYAVTIDKTSYDVTCELVGIYTQLDAFGYVLDLNGEIVTTDDLTPVQTG